MASFELVSQTHASLHPHGEPTDIHADLALSCGESLFDVCDAHSHAMHVLHTLLYEPDEYAFKASVTDQFDALDPDCLVLDYVVLHPKWRGLRLGLLAG